MDSIIRQNQKAYDYLAKSYANEWAGKPDTQLAELFVSYLPPLARVLDVGCGPGQYSYYLVGFHDYRQQVAKFRVDRIVQMEVTDETAVKKPKGFDVSEFFTQGFSMLNGKTCRITLLCESTLMNSIIDRFGEDASTQIVDKNHFTVEATVDLSSNFYGWVFASGGKMKITAPQEAVDGFQRMLESFSER